ncbi:MAG: FtsB family cell division protein [bacterium]
MKRFYKVFFLLFIIVYFGLVIKSITIDLFTIRASELKLSQLKAQLSKLTEERVSLKDKLYRLKYDPNYIEILVREELGWTKPGEIPCIPTKNQ